MSKFRPSPTGRSEQGYILLTLMLFAALLAITAAAVLPDIVFETKRDREEELIHRGVQYSRAIRNYVKKFGRYPTSLTDLENTNQLRFLRKRYKDPITGKDFKLLHLGEVQGSFGPGIAGATSAGALAGALNRGPSQQGAINQPNNQPSAGTGPTGSPASGDASGEDTVGPEQAKAGQLGQFSSGDALGNQVFGGGPIVGVASTSKDKTIREFNKKNHYNEWQFIFDPSTDRGGLLNTPAQPPLQGAVGSVSGGAPGQARPPGQPAQQPQTPPAAPPQ
jgi:type II secretory pathway pseudopilin PulG